MVVELTKIILCPVCGSRLIDADTSVNTQAMAMKVKNTVFHRGTWEPDLYVKCWKCGSSIGITATRNK